MTKMISRQSLLYTGIPVVLAALFIAQAGRADAFILLLHGILIVFGYIAAISDLKTRKISNLLVLAMIAAWAAVMTLKLFLDTSQAVILLGESTLGFALGGVLFLIVYLISGKGLGSGDVKFMAGAGLYLRFGGVLPAVFFGTLLAAFTGLALILAKRIGRKDMIPLAPFLYIGILITVFLQ